jgi:hypothetical protein
LLLDDVATFAQWVDARVAHAFVFCWFVCVCVCVCVCFRTVRMKRLDGSFVLFLAMRKNGKAKTHGEVASVSVSDVKAVNLASEYS